MLGKVVFQKVRKLIKTEKKSKDYMKRVHSAEAIDEALVDFLRVKIRRAEKSLTK